MSDNLNKTIKFTIFSAIAIGTAYILYTNSKQDK